MESNNEFMTQGREIEKHLEAFNELSTAIPALLHVHKRCDTKMLI